MNDLREVRAANPSAMTLDGTRTWLVGDRDVAIIDPGPRLDEHVEALVRAVADARVVAILLTHEHPDHAAAAATLAARTGAPVRSLARRTLSDGDTVATDAGDLVALHTPGHTQDHMAFHWPAGNALFCGDLMMGGAVTALVAPPEGDLGDYLRSLARVRALGPRVVHPAHGPSFDDPVSAIDAYVRHREHRLAQVLGVLSQGRPLTTAAIADAVYGGTLPAALQDAAHGATLAYLACLTDQGRVTGEGGQWRVRE